MFSLFRLILLAIIALAIALFLRPELLKQFGISKTEKQPEVVMDSINEEKSVPAEPQPLLTPSVVPANEPVIENVEKTPAAHQNTASETASVSTAAPMEEPVLLPVVEQSAENSEPAAAETATTEPIEVPAFELPASEPSSTEPMMANEATENTEASVETVPAAEQEPSTMIENAVPTEVPVNDQPTEVQGEALQPQTEAAPEMNVVEAESNTEIVPPSETGEIQSVDTAVEGEAENLENSLMEEIRETFDETEPPAAAPSTEPATAPATTE